MKWMTEVKSRCDHPDEYLILHFDFYEKPYYSCKKCEFDISIDDKKDRNYKSLWE